MDFSKYQAPWAGAPLTVTWVAVAKVFPSVIGADRYAMIGMPTPYVEPSLSYSRTCTGRPVGAGDEDCGTPAGGCADADAECQDAGCEGPPHAASAIPSATNDTADHHR